MRLENKNAVVTGGAMGIGRAISLAFAREGARVAVVDLDTVQADDTVGMISEAAGEAAIGLAILVVYFRNRGSIAVEDINMMKG